MIIDEFRSPSGALVRLCDGEIAEAGMEELARVVWQAAQWPHTFTPHSMGQGAVPTYGSEVEPDGT